MMEQGVSSLLSFITGIMLAKNADIASTGTYALIFSVCLVLLSLQRVFICVPFNVLYPKIRNNTEKKIYLQGIFGIEFVFICIFIIVSLLLWFYMFDDVSVVNFCIFIMCSMVKDFVRQILFGMMKIDTALVLGIVQFMIQVLSLFLLQKFGCLNLNSLLLSVGLGAVLASLSCISRYGSFSLDYGLMISILKKNWWTTKWSVGISLADSIKNQLSIWFLQYYEGVEVVGIYSVNNVLAILPQPIFNGLSQYLLPHFSYLFSNKDYRSVFRKTLASFSVLFVFNSLWFGIMYFFGGYLVGALYDVQYVTSSSVLLLSCVKGLLISVSSILSSALQAMLVPQIILWSLVISLAVFIFSGIVLTSKYSLVGMCVALLVMYLVTVFVQMLKIIRIYKSYKDEK